VKRALLVLALALATAACSSGATGRDRPAPPDRPSAGSGSTGSGAGEVSGATGATGDTAAAEEDALEDPENGNGQEPGGGDADQDDPEGEDGDDAGTGLAEDDLKAFAFATTDEAALAAELTAIAETVLDLQVDLQVRDLDAAEADARTLLDQAEALEADAGAAEQRERALEPEDADLVAARKHALDAFGLTAAYASSVTDIANAVLEGRIADVPELLQDAAELAGTSDDLAQAYADLNAELVAWAEAHPAEATGALAKYGG
jgi:hypothetical protein